MATRTAAQQREQTRIAHQAALEACPTHQVFDLLGDKWVGLILNALGQRPRRHSELARIIAGASQKMLTQTLRGLERDGLVSRSVTAPVPARVDYALTALGRSLLPVMDTVAQWAEQHIHELHAANHSYDAAREHIPSPPTRRQ